jgi:SAM-dependent methyltransferase
MTAREQRLVFGEVAGAYDDVRAGYAADIGERIFAYVGGRSPVVEVGAGTGKATGMLLAAGVAVTCIEPDPQMAAVLRARFGDRVDLVDCGFEDWVPPPGGVPLICSAQAFHWICAELRWRRAHDALTDGGTLALFGHGYGFVDAGLRQEINTVYGRVAPELLNPDDDVATAPEEHWFHVEMVGSGLFTEITSTLISSVVPYPTARYLTLLATFSNHRMLPAGRRERLHAGIAEVVDRRAGVVEVRLDTLLTLGRRAGCRRTNVGPDC